MLEKLGDFKLNNMAVVVQCQTWEVLLVIQLGAERVFLAPETSRRLSAQPIELS
jgi:hypothetical protein